MTNIHADHESESLVLLTLIWRIESRKFLPRVFKQMFDYELHTIVFKGIRELVEEGSPVDMVTLTRKLSTVPESDIVSFCMKIDTPLSDEQMDWHINRLRELYFFRVSLNISAKIGEAVMRHEVDTIIKLGLTFDKVRGTLFRKEGQEDQIKKAVSVINSKIEYIPSSFTSLKNLMGGYTRKQISAIGGKSGHNKTTFTIYECVQQIKMGLLSKIVYFSVDEDSDMVARRVIASEMGISLKEMRDKKIQLDEKEVQSALSTILGDRFLIFDNYTTADQIASAIMELKPDRAIVDHIQELSYGEEGISDAKVMVAAGKLKQAAKLANANVTILSQVRDKLIDERFDSKVPRPHDFLYASDLRRKSREQCVVYWEFKDTQQESSYSFFDFIVWKSTYSETGRVRFAIDPDKARFGDIEPSRKRAAIEGSDIWGTINQQQ